MCSVEQYSQVPQLLQNLNIKIVIDAPSNYWSFIYPNHRVEPNDIPAFRKAVDLAIDKQQIIDFSVAGYGSIPSQTPMVPEALINPDTDWPGLDYETDAERIAAANDMLDAIPLMSDMPADPPDGWVRSYDGEDLVFQLDHQSTPERVRTAEIIKNSLAEVGITMNLNVMGTGAMVAMLFFGEDFENWEWALFGHGASPGWDGLVQEYANPNYNVWYDAPAVGWGDDGEGGGTTSALAAQDAIRAVQLETDPEDQLALAYTAQELYAAEMPVLLGHQANLLYAYNKTNFTNWAPVGHYDGYGSSGWLASNPNLISIMPVAEE
jgi:ABC-type transport system substrate-binding protein